jgi:hypothetical protein
MRKQRMYCLYQKIAGRWLKVGRRGSHPKEVAIRVYQNDLLNGLGLGLELRPVKEGQVGIGMYLVAEFCVRRPGRGWRGAALPGSLFL